MKETRCFNCNYKGHWARDCQKPKREKGTCYHCGAKDHMVAQCTKRKDDIGNNFNAS
ncbi:zinc finger protein GIS2-like [Drosophila mojavensis]|nr:zinc finger protein GIS2-like [Drosophila mojavensis]XP_032589359.2 zinc finger protein GIS2-like [Drosophila mojavensis]XP_043864807.1 zinc finger protein GIS2-like [Drosophila mojavensis]